MSAPRPPIVAIDGPAGAGKSTVARQLALRLGFSMIDTGAIYRSVALAALRAGVDWDDDGGLRKLLDAGFPLRFEAEAGRQRVLLGDDDVSEAIRAPEISRGASVVSARPIVRERLLGLQRALGCGAPVGAVLEGRDIGTVVFPDADVKLFLTAGDAARARRRFDELRERGVEVDFDAVLADQRRRDRDDTDRAIAPLRAAADAVEVDTTGVDLAEVVERCVALCRARLRQG